MKKLKNLEKQIGIKFRDKSLLKNAFIHRSYLNENKGFKLPSNEKLEFLGDSVLSMATSLHLFHTYPKYNEGDYTDIKASIVNTKSLSVAARRLKLGEYLYFSKGEEENNGRDNTSILADCFEALIAAIFLEAGFDKAFLFIDNFLFKDVLDDIVQHKKYLPAKNKLQEYWQDKYKTLPKYRLLAETGPQHNKVFTVGIYHDSKILSKGEGRSKKFAEEAAAKRAVAKLNL